MFILRIVTFRLKIIIFMLQICKLYFIWKAKIGLIDLLDIRYSIKKFYIFIFELFSLCHANSSGTAVPNFTLSNPPPPLCPLFIGLGLLVSNKFFNFSILSWLPD